MKAVFCLILTIVPIDDLGRGIGCDDFYLADIHSIAREVGGWQLGIS